MKRTLSIAVCVVVLALSGFVAAQQPQTPEPKKDLTFDVASIKLSDPNNTSPLGMIPMVLPQGPGRLSASNVPLRLLVRMAYQVQDFQIVGGPSWQTSQKFDIVAKAADDVGLTDTSKLMPMLKSLLEDRFKMKTHMETREMPIEQLVIARSDGKLGPNLRPSTSDCKSAAAQEEQQKRAQAASAALKGDPSALAGLLPKPGEVVPCSMTPMIGGAQGPAAGGTPSFGLRGNGQPVGMLVQLLSQATSKTVQDKTGLMGLYDFELTFDPSVFLRAASQLGINLPQPPAGVNLPPSDSPSLLTALREQLGLKLDSARGPVEVLVIDSAEMPMPD
jgi:uncharacterized protein (TIGR03435 family)